MDEVRMRPIRTYAVRVEGFSEVLFSARSPSKARAQAWHAYDAAFPCSFHRFLTISQVRRVPDPPGIGEGILVCGEPATRVIGRSPVGVYFMRDEGDAIMAAHESEIAPCPLNEANPPNHR